MTNQNTEYIIENSVKSVYILVIYITFISLKNCGKIYNKFVYFGNILPKLPSRDPNMFKNDKYE